MMPLIPKMTSNTTPSGVASGSSYDSSDYEPYKAFDDDIQTAWVPNTTNGAGEWISYKFEKPVCVKKVALGVMQAKQYTHETTFKIQASNNGSDWVDISENLVNNVPVDVQSYNINNNKEYLYYKLYIVSQTHSTTSGGIINTLQFYGK